MYLDIKKTMNMRNIFASTKMLTYLEAIYIIYRIGLGLKVQLIKSRRPPNIKDLVCRSATKTITYDKEPKAGIQEVPKTNVHIMSLLRT